MKKYIAGAALALTITLTPVSTQAAGLTETQIQAILGILNSFGADATIVANVNASLRGQASSAQLSPSACLSLRYDLYADQTDSTTGGEVSKLQRFLGVNPTGFFGPLTQEAVQRWQASRGIVSSGSPDTTGYGYVGPRTRSAMSCVSTAAPPTTVNTQPSFSSQAPSCILTSKPYMVMDGEKTTLSWTSRNATYGVWEQNSSANVLGLSLDKLSANGSQTITIEGGKGTQMPTLRVYAPDGSSATCSTIVNIEVATSQGTATIDQNTLTQPSGSTFSIKGSASNTDEVVVYLVPSSFPYSDFERVAGSYGKDGIYRDYDDVSNGRWGASFSFGNIPDTSFLVLVYDADTGSKALLVTGTLTVNASTVSVPTCTLTPTSYTASSYNYNVPNRIYVKPYTDVTLTWTSQNATYTDAGGGKADTSGSITYDNLSSQGVITYTVTAYGPGGTGTCSTEVVVDWKG